MELIPRDEINNLAYLEAFTREVLRLYSAAASQIRTAAKTITLPLSEPVLGRDGRVMDTITIDKGSMVYMRRFLSPSKGLV